MSASEQALGRPAIEVVAKAKRRQFNENIRGFADKRIESLRSVVLR